MKMHRRNIECHSYIFIGFPSNILLLHFTKIFTHVCVKHESIHYLAL